MSNIEVQAGAFWDVSPAEYHADTECVSHSQLEKFLQSPAKYYGRYVTHELPDEHSTAMDLGTVAHEALLRPDYLDQCVIEIPRNVLAKDGSKRGNAWDDWSEAHADLTQLKSEQLDIVFGIVKAVMRAPQAKRLLDACQLRERAIQWDGGGVRRRALIDALSESGDWAFDLKTTGDVSPQAFIRRILAEGYDRQNAWYVDGLLQKGLLRSGAGFVFIAVENEPPHEVMTYSLPVDWVESCQEENERLVKELLACHATGVWERAGAGRIVQLQRPKWAAKQNEWELIA